MTLPTWATADPLIRYLMASGLTLEEAYGKAERVAMMDELGDVHRGRVTRSVGADEILGALRAWDPVSTPMPVRGYP